MNHIKRYGPVSYSEFMQLCLYEFEDSYYRKQDRIGFQGDFYTSPFLHPVFGSLIAIKLFDMWNSLGQPNSFDVVELGSGNGKLCRDILDYANEISPYMDEIINGLNDSFGKANNTPDATPTIRENIFADKPKPKTKGKGKKTAVKSLQEYYND